MTKAELIAAAAALEWAARDDVEKCAMMDRARELRAKAAAMPAQEPVAWFRPETCTVISVREKHSRVGWAHHYSIPLYTAPPDLSARVAELESALKGLENAASWVALIDNTDLNPDARNLRAALSVARAVLAKEI